MWCMAPLEMNEGNSLGQGYNRPTGCSAEKAPHATFLYLRTSKVTGFQYAATDVVLPGSTTLLRMNAAYTYLDVMTHGPHSQNLFTCSSLTSKQTGADKGINIFNLE